MSFSTSGTEVKVRTLGEWPDGTPVQSFTVASAVLQVEILSFGARLTSLVAPDREGVRADVVLGYPDWRDYLRDDKFLGCTPGRFANRIARGQFQLDGQSYQLNVNNGPNTLHGGTDGFFRRNWAAVPVQDGVRLTLRSPDGDQGFPGALTATVTYTLEEDTLTIDYLATTDKPTVVNLTNHAYFNLAGEGAPSILEHALSLASDQFVPTDEGGIPLGPLVPVEGTPFDFTSPQSMGSRIEVENEQLQRGGGYDHTFVLRGVAGTLRPAALVVEPSTGRRLEIATTEPGIQFYSGNYLDGSGKGVSGRPYLRRSAFCLETQHFPDSPNRPEYPSTVLRPGEEWRSTTAMRFTAS